MRGKNIERTIVFRGTTRINHDDTISQIKAKIVSELSSTEDGGKPDGNTPDVGTPDGNTPDGNISPNHIYLCAETNNQINISHINLANGETSFRQLLTNLEIDASQIPDTFELQDILNSGIKHGNMRPITLGLGMTLTPFDYVFPANPMYIVPGLSISKYVDSINYSGNSILMDAGPLIDNTIYVYFAEDVLAYTRELGIPENDVLRIYFPEYNDAHIKHLTPPVIEFLYDTYYNSSKLALKYQERGIHQYDITLFSKSRALFSLDAIFKNIHSTSEFPFIRYKPGIRRDPIYRLYSTSTTKSGKRIPVLSYRKLNTLVNGSANYKHISIFNDTHNVFIYIENDGTIRISGKVMRTIEGERDEKDKKQVPITASIRELDYLLDQAVNPFLKTLDNYLSKSGYKVPFFTSLNSPSIKINNLSYSTTFDMKTQLKLNNGCAFALFDIADTTKEKMVLRFKRVNNFKKMDAQSALISEVYKKSGSETEVIEALMKNYGMNNKDAILRLLEYQENLNYLKGKHNNRAVERTNMFDSIKNPGFLTTIEERKKGDEKREIKIVVHNLNNIKYIETIGIYIDSLVRLSITDDPTLVEKCNVAIQEEAIEAEEQPNVETEAEAIVAKAQPVDINKLLMQFEERDAIREIESEDEIDLDDFLESDDDAESVVDESDFLESDDEDEDLAGGAPEEDDDLEGIEDDDDGAEGAESEYNTTSKSKKVFIHKLKEHDPKLFSFTKTKNGQFKHYTRVCQSMLQPVILTQEEKDKIDKDYRGSYTEAIEYGSAPDKKHWYICPRFWCFKTNTSMTKKDIDAGKCGKSAAEIKKNVFEFNAPKEHMKSGKYIKHFPGFKTDIHPDGYCLPCCFSEWDTQLHKDRRDQCMGNSNTKAMTAVAPGKADNLYIIGADKTQVDPGRWGFAQYAVQYFLQIDYANHVSKTNSSMIRDKTATILRYGIRQESVVQSNGNVVELRNRSIVAAFADIYARVNQIRTPSVAEFLKIIVNSITIDTFVQYGNGSYISLFDDGDNNDDDFVAVDSYFTKSSVYRFLDMKNKDHYNFFRKLRRSYERFLAFLEDPESVIDHTYFWDIVATPGIFRNGLNLVLMEITNNDVTENIDIICPTSSYSAHQFNIDRESVFMIKTNDIYLPLYKYVPNGKDEPDVQPLFVENDFPAIYKIMASTIENYCKPRASITKKYVSQNGDVVFKQPMALFKMLEELKKIKSYTIEQQVWNYQGKIVYLVLRSNVSGNSVVVPCQPASPLPNVLPATFMDDIRIYSDYETTKRELAELARANINCKPVIKVFESGLIVGIITETNQLVRIAEPEPDVDDELVPLGEENYVFYRDMAKTVETANSGDEERIRVVRNVELEAEFYALFRTTLKSVLESAPVSFAEVSNLVRNKKTTLDEMSGALRKIMEPAVVFGENQMPDELLDEIHKTGQLCQLTGDKHIGMLTESQQCIFPKYNLVNPGRNNSVEYFVRVADELLRYGNLRNFILKPQSVLNISNETYKVNSDEYIVVETDLTDKDYFADMVPYYMNQYMNGIPYDMANPDSKISQKYLNEVSLEEQMAAGSELLEIINKCKSTNMAKNPKDVDGHPVTNYWRRWVFPRDKTRKMREIYFKNSPECSFGALIYILQDYFKELYTEDRVRNMVWEGYAKLIEAGLLNKILDIFEIQGKKLIAESIRKGKSSLKEVVLESPDYFLTMMDIWVVAYTYFVPIIAFSSMKELSGMGISVLEDPLSSNSELPNSWIVMGGKAENRFFYFMRSPTIVYNAKSNIIPEIQVIFGPLAVNELNKLEPLLQSALLKLEYVQRVQGPEYFLKRFNLRKK